MVGQLLDRGTEFTQHSDELFPSVAMADGRRTANGKWMTDGTDPGD